MNRSSYSPSTTLKPNAATDAAADNFDVAAYDPSESEPTSLGDFDRLWRFRGVPTGSHPHRSRHGSTESSSSSISSAGSTAPSSAPEIASDGADGVGKGLDTDEATEGEDFSDFVNRNKAVRWKDEVTTEKKALLVRKLREKKLLAQDFDASLAVARWGENVRSDGLHVRPDHMYDAEKCGYELNILEPVFKVKSLAPVRKNRNGTGNGYATTSGHSSGSDGPTPGTQVRQEQC
ncbi:hypothetical protein M7I_1851 [Glarea lozoyensis 74030]|uniref:Uncharacterized protein n=1 Tax=Glarea lozoyensis (strain ATCC 74030 / MF5533) TaxID=1104152 RepID=H0EH74_GLAL7|nr:hypothetical protein M7I_1851 [Glarea lozoyensis 74030]